MAKTDKPAKEGRLRQLAAAYSMTKEYDRRIGVILLSVFLVVVAVCVGLGFVLGHPILVGIFGVTFGVLVALIVFGRRAERAAYGQVEGRPGAAGAALAMLRRGWTVQQAVAFTKNQDIVHRVVGRPGIVLIGEGNPARVRNLLGVEKRKHTRFAGEAPIYDIIAGDGTEDSVEVKKLARHIMKLPKNLSPGDVTEVMQRLKALDASRPAAPLPRGPLPQSAKAARQMMRGKFNTPR
jgi:Domain of unknown function (DUF4191)